MGRLRTVDITTRAKALERVSDDVTETQMGVRRPKGRRRAATWFFARLVSQTSQIQTGADVVIGMTSRRLRHCAGADREELERDGGPGIPSAHWPFLGFPSSLRGDSMSANLASIGARSHYEKCVSALCCPVYGQPLE